MPPEGESGERRNFGRLLVPAGVFAGAALLCAAHGGGGLQPLDHSIVFDGGYRLLSGQVPWRDFSLPAGLTPSAIQAVLFALFGISWGTYLAHAAVANGLFAVLAWRLLRSFGLGRWQSGFVALASGVVFYPPVGVPYLEHHSFLFSLLALLLSRQAVDSGRRDLAAVSGGAFALALFSKQIPAALFLPLCAVDAWLSPGRARLRTAAWWLAGLFGLATGVVALLLGLGADRREMAASLLGRPLVEGLSRLDGSAPLFEHGAKVKAVWEALPKASTGVALALVVGLIVLWIRRPRGTSRVEEIRSGLRSAVIGLGLAAITLAFCMLTFRPPSSGLGLVFLSLGGLYAGVDGLLRSPSKQLEGRSRIAGLARLTAMTVLAVVAWDASRFEMNVSRTRWANLIAREPSASSSDPQLRFLELRLPFYSRYSPQELLSLLEYLRQRGRPFFLVGDASILYGLTGQPSVSPVLWLHPNIVLPYEGGAVRRDFDERLLGNLQRYGVETVVLEGEATQLGVRLEQFVRSNAWVRARVVREVRFGELRALELGESGKRR